MTLSLSLGSPRLRSLNIQGYISNFATSSYLDAIMARNPLSRLRCLDLRPIRPNTRLPGTGLTWTTRLLESLPAVKEIRIDSFELRKEEMDALEDLSRRKRWDLAFRRTCRCGSFQVQ